MSTKLENVAADAEDAFWAAVAKAYPEIETGDLDPFLSMKFGKMCRDVVAAWVMTNKEAPIGQCDWCGMDDLRIVGTHLHANANLKLCMECEPLAVDCAACKCDLHEDLRAKLPFVPEGDR